MEHPDQTPRLETAAGRLALAFELHELGVAMMRQRLIREHPDAAAAELDTMMEAWLRASPGPELGSSSTESVVAW